MLSCTHQERAKGDVTMTDERKKAAYEYINEHQAKTYDRITILVKKGDKAKIKDIADQKRLSVSQYIVACIEYCQDNHIFD